MFIIWKMKKKKINKQKEYETNTNNKIHQMRIDLYLIYIGIQDRFDIKERGI